MTEAVDPGDGFPSIAEIDRRAAGGLVQARQVFLPGCGLPAAWAGRRQWRILETGFGLGLKFLASWQAWRADPARPALLHFASVQAGPVAAQDIVRAAAFAPELAPLAQELAAQWPGLTPGVHRLAFDGGRVLLTLATGDGLAPLRDFDFAADAIFLDDFDHSRRPEPWELGILKAVARLCRPGTLLATGAVAGQLRRDLATCGFVSEESPGLESLRARYAPRWEVKGLRAEEPLRPARAVVIGAGLAGAALAASLARRGWQVDVLDAAEAPAAGASALPVGLLAPHQSPDDNLLSRLSRAGVRVTLQACRSLLASGDWQDSGALEHRCGDARALPAVPELTPWSRDADAQQRMAAGLAPAEPAWWHAQAAWVRPAALVRAWLAQDGVRFRGGMQVGEITRAGALWQLRQASGELLAQAELVAVAAAHASAPLLQGRIATHPVRGQVSWGLLQPGDALPRFPVNGHGHFVPRVPTPEGEAWFSGSTYGRADSDATARTQDQHANLQRLRELLPTVAAQFEARFAAGDVRAWAGVRCASSDRRPLVGEVETGLWVSTAMGSRGLTFAALCGELIAARLHGEPWPLEARLARAIDVRRMIAAP